MRVHPVQLMLSMISGVMTGCVTLMQHARQQPSVELKPATIPFF